LVLTALSTGACLAAENWPQFRGPSGQGFTIEGWYQNGRINTAYPIFQ